MSKIPFWREMLPRACGPEDCAGRPTQFIAIAFIVCTALALCHLGVGYAVHAGMLGPVARQVLEAVLLVGILALGHGLARPRLSSIPVRNTLAFILVCVVLHQLCEIGGEMEALAELPVFGPGDTVNGILHSLFILAAVGGLFLAIYLLAWEGERQVQELLASEERARLAQQASKVGICEIDLVRDSLHVSDNVAPMFGIEPEAGAVTLSALLARIVPEDRTRVEKELATAIEGARGIETEFRVVLPDGQPRWIGAKASFFPDGDGNLTRFVGTHRDITVEKTLALSLALYQQMVEDSLTPAIIFDTSGRCVLVNPACAAMWGYDSADSLTGRPLSDYFPESDARRELLESLKQDGECITELSAKRSDAGTFIVRVFARSAIDSMKREIYIATLLDVTESNVAEEALRESEERFRTLFNQSTGYCLILDPNTPDGIPVIVDANEAACRVHGYSREELVGRPVADIDDEDGKRLCVSRTKEILTGRPFHTENIHVRKDGSTFPVSVHANRIDIDGKPPLIFSTEYDISDLREAEAAVLQNQERYQSLFDHSPIPLWEQDFSGVKRLIEEYRGQGIVDVRSYVAENPEVANACVERVQIIDVNQAAIRLFAARSKEVFEKGLAIVFSEGSYQAFREILIAIAEGKLACELECTMVTLDGREIEVSLCWLVVPGHENTLGRVYVSTVDITAQREAIRRLSESEEWFRLIYQQSPLAIGLYDIDGNLTSLNPRTLELFGLSDPKYVAGFNFWQDPNLSRENANALREGESVFISTSFDFDAVENVVTFPTSRRGVIYLNMYIAPVYREKKSVGYLAQLVEVTTEKKAEAALRASEERLRLSTELGGVAVWECDLVRNEMARSRNHDGLYGLDTQETWRLESFLGATHPEDRDSSDRIIQDALSPGGPSSYAFDFRVVWPDGSIHWLATVGEIVSRDEVGVATLVRGCLTDITDRKTADEALRMSEERLRMSTEMGGVAVWEYNVAQGAVMTSDNHDKLYGLDSGQDWSVKQVLDLTHPDDRAIVDWSIGKAIKVGGVDKYHFDFRVIWPDGSVHWLEVHGEVVVRDEEGIASLVRGCLIDVTDRKRIEASLQQARNVFEAQVQERTAELAARTEEAEALNVTLTHVLDDAEKSNRELEAAHRALKVTTRELEAFSYSVSHDLRAPLRHITGFVDLFTETCAESLDERGQRYLEKIAGSAERMGRLIDDLLAFSRAGRVELQKTEVDLNALIAEVRPEVTSGAGDRSIAWDIGVLPRVVGDRAMLRQVLANYLDNAVKYTQGCLEAHIQVGTEDSDRDEVVVFVRDNGAGFEMQYVDKLFGVFQRLHSADEFKGSGVGLANVRRIVQRHGGRTWAAGRTGEGATFYFSLPLGEQCRSMDADVDSAGDCEIV